MMSFTSSDKTKNACFILAYSIYYVGLLIQTTNMEQASDIKKLCNILSLTLMVLICINKVNHNRPVSFKMAASYFCAGIIIIMSMYTMDFFFITLMLFYFASHSMGYGEETRIYRVSGYLLLLVLVSVSILCFAGVIDDLNTPRSMWEYYSGDRFARGFAHSQIPTLLVLYLILYFFTYKKRVGLVDFIVSQLLMILMSYIFDARTSLYVLECFFVMQLVFKIASIISKRRRGVVRRIVSVICKTSFMIFAALSFLLLYLYNQDYSIVKKIDLALSSRLRISSILFSENPIRFLRMQSFDDYVNNLSGYPMDCGYFYLVLRYGIISLLFFSIVLFFLAKHYDNQNNKCGLCAVFSISVTNLMNGTLVGCYCLPFLILGLNCIRYEVCKAKHISLCCGREGNVMCLNRKAM